MTTSILFLTLSSPEKLAPDACPAARNRKRFDPSKSNALNVLLMHEQGNLFPEVQQDEAIRRE